MCFVAYVKISKHPRLMAVQRIPDLMFVVTGYKYTAAYSQVTLRWQFSWRTDVSDCTAVSVAKPTDFSVDLLILSTDQHSFSTEVSYELVKRSLN